MDGPGGREAGGGAKLPPGSGVSDVKSIPAGNNGGGIAVRVFDKDNLTDGSN